MKLTDMNFDCLVHCFRYLSVEELLNVADSNKKLKFPASEAFARLCRRKIVFLHVLKSCWERCCCKSNDEEKVLGVYHLKMGLQLLRSFGNRVSDMEVNFQNTYNFKPDYMIARFDNFTVDYFMQCAKAYEHEHLIIEYINDYSSKSLKSIKFSGNQFGDLNKLTKEFVNVSKLEVNTVFPRDKKLVELFPNVRQLKLDYSRTIHTHDDDIFLHNDIASQFPYLEQLSIEKGRYKVNHGNVATALRWNPQLKTLKGNVWIDVIFHTDDFWDSDEHLQNLESLELVVESNTLSAKTIGKNIHLRNLKELCFYAYTDWEPSAIPFSSDKLESLTIFTNYVTDVNKIIDKYPTLKKLHIEADGPVEFNFSRIWNTVPILEDICIDCNKTWYLTFDTVLLVINSFPFLRLFTFFSSPPFETDWSHLLNGWSISHEERYIRFALNPLNHELKIVLKRLN